MINMQMSGQVGSVLVATTDHRGWTVEEIAQRATDRIVYVGNSSHPLVRDQAIAFKEEIKGVIAAYLREAVDQDRVTMANRLREAGHPELVRLLGE